MYYIHKYHGSLSRENTVDQIGLDFTQMDSKGNFKWQYYHDNYGYDLGIRFLQKSGFFLRWMS
jgi:hypothetical protein